MKNKIILSAIFMLLIITSFSRDKKFYIFLSFGQSNMEGNAKIRAEDTIGIDSRFQVMEAVDCPNLNRKKGEWYTAIPPLCRCHTGLTLTDFFWQNNGSQSTQRC